MADHRETRVRRRVGSMLPSAGVPRALLYTVTAAASIAVLAGCTSVINTPGAQSPQTLPGTAQPVDVDPTDDAPATPETPSTPEQPSTPSADPSRPPKPGIGACATDQLKITMKAPDAGAGSVNVALIFTNASKLPCTLSGYPGVSYVAEKGVQSGNAAGRSGERATTVTLKPGGAAVALLRDSNGAGGYDPKECMLAPALGLRIYPPNQKVAAFLSWKTSHCTGKTINSLTVGPVVG
ncbi:DUF4232 domain-containing protein [Planotetraspora kaengkrachanensis]|uniref:DUF4232 domain-containing protein n=1 Tax=Planotetraspora kaengkrachanensis TaxID=575193 RepID=A0A8J3V856_9ACTN|nr:DUF4232 domain-containing protein [Planotetraspora kaengkrachanensis]GIG81941.1 hypothetical protein Pka01_50680 [Planotetraspora kaengkrachanensis]